MNIVKFAASSVTVELSIPDCLTLAAAALSAIRNDSDTPFDYTEALANGLVAHAFAAFLLDDTGQPPTIAAMWAMWAPHTIRHDPMPMPYLLTRSLNEQADD
jgi:hypothetical protein